MYVLAGDRQGLKTAEHVATDRGQFGGIVRADVEDGGLLFGFERIEADGENG